MRFGIDIDDTITEVQKIRITCIKKFIRKTNYKIFNEKEKSFLKICDWDYDTARLCWEKYNKKILFPKINKFVKNVFRYLRNSENKIFIITSRNEEDFKNITDETIKWLKKNEIEYDYIFTGIQDKLKFCLDNKINVMIDDNDELIVQCKKNGLRAFGIGINKEFGNWNDFLKILTKGDLY